MHEPSRHPRHNDLWEMPGKRRRFDWPILGLVLLLALFAVVGTDDFRTAQLEHAHFQNR